MTINTNISDRAAALKAEALDNSSLFDVHVWASDEAKEVNNAVHIIYQQLVTDTNFKGHVNIRRKHIKTLLLDLYIKWLTDPKKYVSIYLRHEYYEKLVSRYNKLHISSTTTIIVHALRKSGYIEFEKGHYWDPLRNIQEAKSKKSHVTRIRATRKLIDLIKRVKIKPEMVERVPNIETIILRKYDLEKSRSIDCKYNDTPKRIEWRKSLVAYNNLLRKTYIDIPNAPPEGIPCKQGARAIRKKKKPRRVRITQYEKFVRRIFNNERWDHGGRFYGGWWQRLPEKWREQIRIWNSPIQERDYKGLHISLLYKIEHETMVGDPYVLDGYENTDEMRSFLKKALLSAINAKNIGEAVKVLNMEINFDLDTYGWIREEKIDLKKLILALRDKHPKIKDHFFNAKGIELQNIDALMAQNIIDKFTSEGVPVLCIHDSFIIRADKAEALDKQMTIAFNEAMDQMGLDSNSRPETDFDGMETGLFHAMITRPEWIELKIAFYKEKNNYPEWDKKMQDFKRLNLFDHYVI